MYEWSHLFQAANNEADTSSRVGRYLGLSIRDAWKDLTGKVDDLLDQI